MSDEQGQPEQKFPVIPLAIVALLGIAAFVAWPTFAHRDEPAVTENDDGIPDGTPEEILDFVNKRAQKLQTNPPDSEDALREELRLIVKAAGKVLEADPEDKDVRMKAIEAKIGTLGALRRFGDDSANGELKTFLTSLKSAEDEDVRNLAQQQLFIARATEFAGLSEADRKTLIDDVKTWMKAGNLADRLSAGGGVAQTLAQVGHTDEAVAMYRYTAGLMKNSGDEKLASKATMVEGLARQLTLPGSTLEVLRGTTVNGKPFDWSKYRGKVVLIDFWATWCGPCIAEIPNILSNYREYHDRGFEVVGVNLSVNETPEQVKSKVRRLNIPWPTLFHTGEGQHPMAEYYGVQGIPFTILVGRDGKVIAMHVRGGQLGQLLAREFDASSKNAPNPPTGE